MEMTRTWKRFCPHLLRVRFSPTLWQFSECGIGLTPNEPNPENPTKVQVSFLSVLAYDSAIITQIDAGGVLDIAMAGISATLLACKWESALLVNADNDTLRHIQTYGLTTGCSGWSVAPPAAESEH